LEKCSPKCLKVPSRFLKKVKTLTPFHRQTMLHSRMVSNF
jgi:hypothetical protein